MPPIRFPLTESLNLLIHDQHRGQAGHNQLDASDRVMLGERSVPATSAHQCAETYRPTSYLRYMVHLDPSPLGLD